MCIGNHQHIHFTIKYSTQIGHHTLTHIYTFNGQYFYGYNPKTVNAYVKKKQKKTGQSILRLCSKSVSQKLIKSFGFFCNFFQSTLQHYHITSGKIKILFDANSNPY